MIRINNVSLSLDSTEDKLHKKVARVLGVHPAAIKKIEIVKKAIDARNKKNVFFVYSVDIEIDDEQKYVKIKNVSIAPTKEEGSREARLKGKPSLRPVIVGSGPAGLFAALTLAEAGLNPIIIERGYPAPERAVHVETFWSEAKLDPNSNVQFGEGGAGTFSDGKLTTGINDYRIRKVLDELVTLGAPSEIKYLAKPHIGTDKLLDVLVNMRKKIEGLGGEYRFNTQLVDIMINDGRLEAIVLKDLLSGDEVTEMCGMLILAIGHSARDTFEMLERNNIEMESKSFSVGVRIEHKQSDINKSQYGEFWNHPRLGAADYKLNTKSGGRGVYTFCMCPGGTVVGAASELNRLVVNGMSKYARDEENANSALLVSVSPEDFSGESPLRGMHFQRELEEKAFSLGGGNYNAPVQLVGDFLADRASTILGDVCPSHRPGYELTDLRECLPNFVTNSLKNAILDMRQKLKNFDKFDATLTAVESRSSSPVRIYRDNAYESSISGIIPCGEGAGYAGGIMSACVDGVKCAESLIKLVDMRGLSK